MAAQPGPPPVQLIEAGPGHATVIDGLVAAFRRHEGASLTSGRRRASIDGLLGEPAHGRILLVQSNNTGIVGYTVLAFGFSFEFGGREYISG